MLFFLLARVTSLSNYSAWSCQELAQHKGMQASRHDSLVQVQAALPVAEFAAEHLIQCGRALADVVQGRTSACEPHRLWGQSHINTSKTQHKLAQECVERRTYGGLVACTVGAPDQLGVPVFLVTKVDCAGQGSG